MLKHQQHLDKSKRSTKNIQKCDYTVLYTVDPITRQRSEKNTSQRQIDIFFKPRAITPVETPLSGITIVEKTRETSAPTDTANTYPLVHIVSFVKLAKTSNN